MNYFAKITPIIIAIFGTSNIYITVGVMILGFIFENFEMPTFIKKHKLCTYTLVDNGKWCSYSDYDKVIWFIVNNYKDLLKNFISKNAQSVAYGKKKDKLNLKTEIEHCSDVELIYDNEKIYVSKGKEEEKNSEKRLILSSSNKDVLTNFVEHCILEYNKHYEIMKNGDNRSIFTISGAKWSSVPINIHKTFKNVFINEKIKKLIKNSLDIFLNNEDFYREKGLPYKKGYIFYGSPGTGKSSLTYAISSYTNRDIYSVNLSTITNDKFKKLVEKIPSGSVVVFEDADVGLKGLNRNLTKKSSDSSTPSNVNNSNRVDLATILEFLDGYNRSHNRIVIMTTNVMDDFDDAIIRPGRIDHKIEIGYPNEETINEMYKFFLKREATNEELLELKNKSSSYIINSKLLVQLGN